MSSLKVMSMSGFSAMASRRDLNLIQFCFQKKIWESYSLWWADLESTWKRKSTGMPTSLLPSPDMEKRGCVSEVDPETLSSTTPPTAPSRSRLRAFSVESVGGVLRPS